jgi:hypothetical protein
MKHLLIILLAIICANTVIAQGTFVKTVKTASDIKSENVVSKLSQSVELSDAQKLSLQEITTNYLNGIDELNGQPNTTEQRNELETERDKKAKVILSNDTAISEYQKYVAELFVKTNIGSRR